MKIISLQAENVKRLKAVQITPEGNTVVIAGKNGQGKTSVLDAIWYALGGGQSTKDTPRPIRDGAESASVTLDLGEYKVSRNWTANDKSYLKVENKDGARFPSPQVLLDKLVGRLSFDPLAFASMDAKTQLTALMDVVELGIDPAKLDADRLSIFNERTTVNRALKQLEGQLAGMPAPATDTPAEEVSAAAIMAEFQKANAQASNNNQERRVLAEVEAQEQAADSRAQRISDQIELLAVQLDEAQDALRKHTASKNAMAAKVAALVDPDLSGYRDRLAAVESTNRAVRAAKQRAQVAAQVKATKAESDALTAKIDAIDEKKSAAMKAAKFPVTGLAFDEYGVTYKAIPFKQCSSAEQLRVSLAMAMALNPKLRVIRITDGSLLDSDNMALISEMAAERDYQVWVERVDDSGTVGIVIEDGMVKGQELPVKAAVTEGKRETVDPNTLF